MGPGGDEYLQQVIREGEEAEVRVANMVFPVCDSLRELWIGNTTRAVVVRSDDGSLSNITMSRNEKQRDFDHSPGKSFAFARSVRQLVSEE